MDFATTRVLVTGAGGFLGARLARRLLELGVPVIAGVRPGANLWRLETVKNRLRLLPLDLSRRDALEPALRSEEPQIVIHAAAYGVNPSQRDPAHSIDVNLLGSLALLQACSRVQVCRFLQMGSCFEYALKDGPLEENDPLNPVSLYGAVKGAASLVVPPLAQALKMDAVVLRLFGLWGPDEDAHRLVPQILRGFLTRTPILLTGGLQRRDFSYVDDIAETLVRFAFADAFPAQSLLNVGSGRPVTVEAFARSIAGVLGCEELLRFGALPYRPRELGSLYPSLRRWTELHGPIPTTRLSEAVEDTLRAFRARAAPPSDTSCAF